MYPRLNYSQGSALVTGSSISISSVETGCRLYVLQAPVTNSSLMFTKNTFDYSVMLHSRAYRLM